MYGNTPEGVEARDDVTLEAIHKVVGPCREWCDDRLNICGEPAEYVLWGKLIPAEGLGPRCYGHAAAHVGHNALYQGANFALIHIGALVHAIDEAHWPHLQGGRS